jgi:hypothetical protein
MDWMERKNTNIIKRCMPILLKKLQKRHMVALSMNEEATINFVHKCRSRLQERSERYHFLNDDDPQARAAELAAEGDHDSAMIWRLITERALLCPRVGLTCPFMGSEADRAETPDRFFIKNFTRQKSKLSPGAETQDVDLSA